MTTQSVHGRISLFDHFFNGNNVLMSATGGLAFAIGDFRVFGNGIDEDDAGAPVIADVPNGAIRLTTTDESAHTAAVGTSAGLLASTNGPLVAEARVQMENLDTKTVWFGFSNDAADTAAAPVTGSTTTLTLSDANLAGFVLDAGLTSDEEWHFAHKGGTTTGVTDSTALVSGVDAVAGEWDILRVEIDPNGTARWYINGTLGKTLAGAISPTDHIAAYVMVSAAGNAIETCDVDFLAVDGSMDWSR